ncbi:MAG: GTPase [Thaumarchaeota archaeon]|nr:GTPase [Nitrososphaerota archaeon]
MILGAAGRDFHNFNVRFREDDSFKVVAFTATQIPYISRRTYPPNAAGRLYPQGIPIRPEEELPSLIRKHSVTDVYFSYSDVSEGYVMNLASIAQAEGASFHLLGPADTMIRSTKPLVAVVAVRTGAGKSTISRKVADLLLERGLRPVVVRHPMPYGDLSVLVQRFENHDDLDRYHTTIEEREEYEGHIDKGIVVFAGVDYKLILDQAEKEGDVILWDGGNNDFSFYAPDLNIVVADPVRVGDEGSYYPGKTNVRMADILVVNKVNIVRKKAADQVVRNCRALNSRVKIAKTRSEAVLDKPELVRGKKILAVEDGPSVTHGGLSIGAGAVAAKAVGATLVDPKGRAVGSIKAAYKKFPNLGKVLPALGYSGRQLKDLESSIERVKCDAVVLGTPSDLTKMIRIRKPVARVGFEAARYGRPSFDEIVHSELDRLRIGRSK